ncbi:MAG: DUF6057 family protein [Prevotellaceae bacterium]|nr:DUF6057 family protein [Prevotellaceae bacterium]
MTFKSVLGKLKNHASIIVWLISLAFVAGLLLSYEKHVLWLVQEQSLFLDTSQFFSQQMVVPGGLLVYIGCFLTQLLYHPVLGVTVLCALWLLLMWLLRRAFMVGERWASLLVVPVALLLIANVDMGYWVYPIKLKGWYFDATVGVTVIAALLWAFRVLSAYRIWRRVLIVVTVAAGYPLFGTYAIAAAVLMGLWCWRLDKDRWQALVDCILALLMVVAIPLLCYQYVYNQVNMANLWWTGLPIFKIIDEYPEFYVPYALLGACLLILTVGKWNTAAKQEQSAPSPVTTERKRTQKNSKKQKSSSKKYRGWWQTAIVIIVLAATVYGVNAAWMKDENFHHETAMKHFIEQTRWEDVLAEADKQQDMPTRGVVVMRNLALSRLGRQSTEMYRYRNGSKQPASPFPFQLSMMIGNLLYYNYGMFNDCHHMCVEAGVEFGWHVEQLKYMARCNLMNDEVNAMLKYTRLLKHTLFHGEWADNMEKLQKPELKRKDRETGPIMHTMHHYDNVGADHGYAEKYLMNHLAIIDCDDPEFQEQCVLATLWTKSSLHFWYRFKRYLELNPGKPVPRYFMEAAYLYTTEEKKALFNMSFDEGVKKTYQEFIDQLPKYDGMDIDDVRSALYPRFGDTFFFDYYLMDDLKFI